MSSHETEQTAEKQVFLSTQDEQALRSGCKDVRLQCTNCFVIKSFDFTLADLPSRCEECKLLVGWLPPFCFNGDREKEKTPCYKETRYEEPVSQKTEAFLNQVFNENNRNRTRNRNRNRNQNRNRNRENRQPEKA